MLDDLALGYDTVVSMKTSEIGTYVQGLRDVETALGSGMKLMSKEELVNRKNNRKSVFYSRDLNPGEMVTPDALIALRPGTGIPPSEREQILGRTVKVVARKGEMVQWNDLA